MREKIINFLRKSRIISALRRFFHTYQVLTALKKVEYYQPLYNFPLLTTEQPQRKCVDRADVIGERLKKLGNGFHILDIGCSLGYFSYYLAERDYQVTGVDTVADNIEVCKKLIKFNGKAPKFLVEKLSLDYVDALCEGQFNVVIILSVVHHIIQASGIEYVQKMMRNLLDKIPVLFIELAVKQEEVSFAWKDSLPENELDIFANCQDMEIERLGYFSNHLSKIKRPLYMVYKKCITINNQKYDIKNIFFSAYNNAPWQQRFYCDCGDYFIKRMFHEKSYNKSRVSREVECYQILPKSDFFPKLISFAEKENCSELILTRLPGENLYEILMKDKSLKMAKFTIFNYLIKALKELRSVGLFYNDIRLWNIMVDDSQLYLLDFELASDVEVENTNLALLWIIAQLHRFLPQEIRHPISALPEFDFESAGQEFKEVIKILLSTQSFDEFLLQAKY